MHRSQKVKCWNGLASIAFCVDVVLNQTTSRSLHKTKQKIPYHHQHHEELERCYPEPLHPTNTDHTLQDLPESKDLQCGCVLTVPPGQQEQWQPPQATRTSTTATAAHEKAFWQARSVRPHLQTHLSRTITVPVRAQESLVLSKGNTTASNRDLRFEHERTGPRQVRFAH